MKNEDDVNSAGRNRAMNATNLLSNLNEPAFSPLLSLLWYVNYIVMTVKWLQMLVYRTNKELEKWKKLV